MPLLFRSGLLFAFTAVCLQIAVFLQPLLPKQYQIAPVCETITKALLLPQVQAEQSQSQHHAHHHSHQLEQASNLHLRTIITIPIINVSTVRYMPI
jgi:hypothetical protein